MPGMPHDEMVSGTPPGRGRVARETPSVSPSVLRPPPARPRAAAAVDAAAADPAADAGTELLAASSRLDERFGRTASLGPALPARDVPSGVAKSRRPGTNLPRAALLKPTETKGGGAQQTDSTGEHPGPKRWGNPIVALIRMAPLPVRKVVLSHRRDCHSAAPPSTFIRCFNSDGEGVSSKLQSRRRLKIVILAAFYPSLGW